MKNILFVCTGNTCRSPMAQGICNKLAADMGLDVKAMSAGVATVTGMPISVNAKKVCEEIGVDISNLKATFIHDLILGDFDHIYVMSDSHKEILASLGVDRRDITILGKDNRGICDPFGGDLTIYRKCRDELYETIENALKEL